MKKILLLISLFSLFSCDEVLIEENRRIEIKGSIRSLENEPVSGIQIISIGTRNGQVTSNPDKLLGKGLSGENGSFNFISLDTYSHDLLLAINSEEIDHNANYASVYFYDNLENHPGLYDLGDRVIARSVEFELNIANTSSTEDTLRYFIEYQQPIQNFSYMNGAFVEQETNNNNFISIREHRPDSDPQSFVFSTLEGTEFIFSYNIGENPVEHIRIPVSVENNSYDFEY